MSKTTARREVEVVITIPARLGVHGDGRSGLLRYDRTAH